MTVSVIGFGVVAAILLFVLATRTSLLTALMISITFGTTSAVTLSSVGGSSPLIYTVLAAIFLVGASARIHIWQDIGKLLGQSVIPWLICILLVYTVVGALFIPRVFAGQTTVFVASRERLGIFEIPLAPVSQNISQAAYFVLGGLVFLGVTIVLQKHARLADIRKSYFYWAYANAGLGIVDLAGKLAGMGDVLSPIRTANYALLTDASQENFWRIAGGQSEASTFAAMALANLAFVFTYWYKTGNRAAFWLSIVLLALLIFSTSSTAYVGLGLLSLPLGYTILHSLFSRRLDHRQAVIVSLGMLCVLFLLLVEIVNPAAMAPFHNMINTMVFQKLSSSSAHERLYWNYKNLQSFIDTNGLGVGIGSSKASSWLIAVISQLGLFGIFIFTLLVMSLLRKIPKSMMSGRTEVEAVLAGVRNSAIASLLSNSLISGTADPGMMFFISLAITSTYYRHLAAEGINRFDVSSKNAAPYPA